MGKNIIGDIKMKQKLHLHAKVYDAENDNDL